MLINGARKSMRCGGRSITNTRAQPYRITAFLIRWHPHSPPTNHRAGTRPCRDTSPAIYCLSVSSYISPFSPWHFRIQSLCTPTKGVFASKSSKAIVEPQKPLSHHQITTPIVPFILSVAGSELFSTCAIYRETSAHFLFFFLLDANTLTHTHTNPSPEKYLNVLL